MKALITALPLNSCIFLSYCEICNRFTKFKLLCGFEHLQSVLKMESGKKRKRFSLAEKLEILAFVDKTSGSQTFIASTLGISQSTLATIVKNREEIEKCASECGKFSKKRKSMKVSPLSDLEKALVTWFEQVRSTNLPVSSNLLKEKAVQLAEHLGIQNFCASNGWIDRFRQRYNIVYKTVSGESKSVNPEIIKQWKDTELSNYLKDYAPNDIFNMDETALFFNLHPNKTLCYKKEPCFGGKKSKERLTVLLAANSTGSEKLTPLVIGKSRKPRCFKNVKDLPTIYHSNRKSWMTSNLFKDYIEALDVKMRKKQRKILLFIDQCPAHPKINTLQNIKLVFLPANSTSELQPMDLGIIRSFKVHYRKCLLRKFLLSIDSFAADERKLKVNVLEALELIRQSWNAVKDETIANCFKKAGIFTPEFDESENIDEEIDLEECETAAWNDIASQNLSFVDYVNSDSHVPVCESQTIQEIYDEQMQSPSDSDLDSDTEFEKITKVTSVEASAGLDAVKKYLMRFDMNEHLYDAFAKIEKAISDATFKEKTKQTTINDFFAK